MANLGAKKKSELIDIITRKDSVEIELRTKLEEMTARCKEAEEKEALNFNKYKALRTADSKRLDDLDKRYHALSMDAEGMNMRICDLDNQIEVDKHKIAEYEADLESKDEQLTLLEEEYQKEHKQNNHLRIALAVAFVAIVVLAII